MTTYFLWVKGPTGLAFPQKWIGDNFVNPETKKNRLDDENVLFKQKLSDKEAGMSLKELKFVYLLPNVNNSK